jgi:hypothetical protein
MPNYTFENTETGEITEHWMSISARDAFVKENPHLTQLITGAPMVVSGTDFNKKMDGGWKENLSRIAEAHPNSALAEKVGGRSSVQTKRSELSKKHKLDKGSYKMKEL